MTSLGWLLAMSHWTIGVVHVWWGIGGLWPAHSEQSLARAVVGFRGIHQMPSMTASFVVAALLLLIGHLALITAGIVRSDLPVGFVQLCAGVAAVVFLARGLAAYLPPWRRLTPEQPFATLDRTIYGPLCCALGLGFLALLYEGSH